jgi:methionine sulfoxide reductase heme-binding subunit
MTSNSAALWYLSRGTGVVTLVLFTVVMVLGAITRNGRPLPGLPRFAVAGLHRNAALLAVVFLAVHIGTAVIDPFVTIRWIDAVVPFGSAYQPFWLGLGAIAVDLMLAIVVTSLLRHRIGRPVWRAVHWTAYLCWPIALVHSFVLGPDLRSGYQLLLGVFCVLVTAAAIGWRIAVAARESSAADRSGFAVAAAGQSVRTAEFSQRRSVR